MNRILCGAAERIITPPLGLTIPGYFNVRRGSGIKSDLYTHVLVTDNGRGSVAVVSLDYCAIGRAQVRKIREAVSSAIGVEKKAIMVHATHIHTGGPMYLADGTNYPNEAWETYMIAQTVEAAKEAYASRKPATLRVGEGEETRIGFCRILWMKDGTGRTNPGSKHLPDVTGPMYDIDRSVVVMRFDDEAGKPIAQIVNYACHPDTVGGTEYCADYPGAMRRVLKKTYGEDMTVIFLNGCCGNVNHIDFMRKKCDPDYKPGPDHYRWMGECLAETVMRINETGLTVDESTEIGFASKTFRGPRRQPTREQYEEALAVLADPESPFGSRFYAKERKFLYEKPIAYTLIEIQSLRIGSCGLSALPGECFSDMGQRVKEKSPFRINVVAELANGYHGYIPTEPAFSAGPNVYETKLAKDNAYLSPETAYKMSDTAAELLCRLIK